MSEEDTREELLRVCKKLRDAVEGEPAYLTLVALRMLRHFAVDMDIITEEGATEADAVGNKLSLKEASRH